MKKRWMKQIVTFLLAFAMLVSGELPAVVSAEPLEVSDEAAGGTNSGTGLESDLNVSGSNGFGNLLAAEFDQKAEEQQENNGYNIFSVEMDAGRKNAAVSFETLQDATLTVGVFDEKGVKLLASGSQKVSAGETDVTIAIAGDIPQYFYLSAFLADSESLRPLCTSYRSPMYTKEMQEFLAKKTTDFDSDKVLNLDNDTDNNFAVYADETKIIPQRDDVNTVKEADDTKSTYVIENADSAVTSLQKGEIFAYQYVSESGEDEFLIVKVADIFVDGNDTATIHGDEISTEDAFEYIKIDEEAGLDKAQIDTSSLDEGVTYNGLMDENTPEAVNFDRKTQLYGWSQEGKFNKELSYTIAEKKTEFDDGNHTSEKVELSGELKLKLDTSAKLYYSRSLKYVELKIDYSEQVSVKVSASVSCEKRLGLIGISPVPGVYLELTPKFVVKVSGKIELDGKLKGTLGIRISSDEGFRNLSSLPHFEPELKGEIIVFIGVALEAKAKVISDKVAKISLQATIGAEIKGVLALKPASASKIHDCERCVDGEIIGKLELEIKASLTEMTYNKMTAGISTKISDFYYSMDYGDMGFTKCPHYKYRIDFAVSGENNQAVQGVKIKAPFVDSTDISTDAKGNASGYLQAGEYTVKISADGYEAVDKKIVVVDDAKRFNIILKKKNDESTDKEDDSFLKVSQLIMGYGDSIAITEDGSLYMWGDNGQMGEETTTVNSIPVKVLSDVKSVSIGYKHGGAITKDGSLYMWGDNKHGQVGDGTTTDRTTPVKVLSDVESMSFGNLFSGAYSGAITKDGSLYMWGDNESGQVGDGTTTDRVTPVKVLSDVVSVSLGGVHSGAITKDGSLYMWGFNKSGQVGDGTTTNRTTPVKVLSDVESMSLGCWHSGAVTKDGSLYTWGGANTNEHVEDGMTTYGTIPVKVLSDVESVKLETFHGGAITKDGSLYMWGNNDCGEVGDGTTTDKTTPVKVLSDVESMSLGCWHSGAVTQDGSLYMWGANGGGEVGDGTTTIRTAPVKVLSDVESVSLGSWHSGAITKDGSLYMWGSNDNGEVGDGTTILRTSPTRIIIPPSAGTETKGFSNTKSASRKAVAADISLKSVPAGTDISVEEAEKTAEFTDLQPDTDYAFYLLKSRDQADLLAASNLLYINQCRTDSAGKLTVTYQAKEACDSAVQLVVGMAGIVLKDANVSVSNLTYTGAEQRIFPAVTYKGKTLVEGTDYEVSGDISAKNKGTYSLTVTGIGDYSGIVTKTYQIKSGSSSGDGTSSGGGASSGDNSASEDNSASGDSSTADNTTNTAATKTEKTTITNSAGKKVQITKKTTTDVSGKVTEISETYKITGAVKNTNVTVTVKKDGTGSVLTAKAAVTRLGEETNSGNIQTKVSGSVAGQIVEAAGISDVVVTQKVVDEEGNTLYTLLYNTKDLITGEKFTLVKVNKQTGEKTLVNKKTYKLSDAGNISVTIDGKGTYQLLNKHDADVLSKKILKTVKLKASSKTLKVNKTYTVSMSKKLNMKNVKSITFTSSKKSVATVNKKTGKVKAKKAGTTTITAKVTLKNGKVKKVKMKIKVDVSRSIPATYTVKPGDSLTSIAKKYNTTVAALAKLNNIKNVNDITIGQVIKLR